MTWSQTTLGGPTGSAMYGQSPCPSLFPGRAILSCVALARGCCHKCIHHGACPPRSARVRDGCILQDPLHSSSRGRTLDCGHSLARVNVYRPSLLLLLDDSSARGCVADECLVGVQPSSCSLTETQSGQSELRTFVNECRRVAESKEANKIGRIRRGRMKEYRRRN